ncbi:SUKH-4 family immunity protein [Streptomyces sp. NRRL S-340]|uniref:SUKH-4 family immunity protein n=1 Tax=Streptomyces sp. NRRL S-340 TaxID=1463901 RepID=UPI000D1B76DA|nr:SUKH-4 family immunity protein [Streptomyces sp. NRRL S-340]
MSTTGTATAVITSPGAGPGPYGPHTPACRRPAGPGLPADGTLLTCGVLRRDGPRAAADFAGDPGRLTAEPRERPVPGRAAKVAPPAFGRQVPPTPRRLARALAALPGPSACARYEDAPPPRDRPHRTPQGPPSGRTALLSKHAPGALLSPGGPESGPRLPDGGTGEISTTYLPHGRPALMDARPPAPSLRALVRFAAVTEELAGLRGRFASRAGRYGPEAVAEASRRLLAVFEAGPDGRVPPFWKAAALVRPLALTAGPGTRSGLTLDLPARLLEREFGPGRVARFEDIDFPATLTHGPTRRFLRETGLPEDGSLFRLNTEVPLPTLAEHYADEDSAGVRPTRLPVPAGRLIRLGHLVEGNSLVVDGGTGAVWNWSESEVALHPLSTDVSTLAFTLWLLHREKRTDAGPGGEPGTEAYDQLATSMIQVLASAGPAGEEPGTDRHRWAKTFRDGAGGVL